MFEQKYTLLPYVLDALEHHPFLELEIYQAYFGSVQAAIQLAE